MRINKKLGCMSLLMFSPLAVAMQPIDDHNLSEMTGQSGISVGVGVNKVQFNQIAIIDRDGLGTTVSDANSASLVVAGTDKDAQSFNVTFSGTPNNKSVMNAIIDTDGGAGKPFANIALGFDSGITGLKISPFALYLASAAATSSPTASKSIFNTSGQNTGVTRILQMKDGFDINFGALKPVFNLQLGNAPQNRMIVFGGSIQSICASGTGCAISVLSDGSDIGANFDFQLKASDTANGFALTGFSAGVESGGFVFGNTGESSKVDVGLNNVIMGTTGLANTSGSFAGVQNGSMGNFGVVGASVTDLKVKISGL